MKDLAGKVAAITGAGSGIGRALAHAFAAEGMHIAAADVDTDALATLARELERSATQALTLRVDVADAQAVAHFADATRARFGAVHVVCNNAGVCPVGPAWETTLEDWRWVVDVNLWGVIHGVHAFTPHLLRQDEGHIVNTASVAGLIAPAGFGAYSLTKHGVIALSEALHHDLRERGSAIGVSVLCPAYVPTQLADTVARRSAARSTPPATRAKEDALREAVHAGRLTADDIARQVVDAVREDRFYVLPHPRIDGAIRARMEDILARRAPRDPMRR